MEQLFRLLTHYTRTHKHTKNYAVWMNGTSVCLLNKTSAVEQHIFSIEANSDFYDTTHFNSSNVP